MWEQLELGTTPCDEECIQVSKTEDYMPAMRDEAQRFRKAVHAWMQPACDAVVAKFDADLGEYELRLVITNNAHDFGNYLDVVVKYNTDNKFATYIAYMLESSLPRTWAELEEHTVSTERIEKLLNNIEFGDSDEM